MCCSSGGVVRLHSSCGALTSSVSCLTTSPSHHISPQWLFQTIGSSCELVKTLWNVAKEAVWPANGFNWTSGNPPPQQLIVKECKVRLKSVETPATATTHTQRFNLSQKLQWLTDYYWNIILPVSVQKHSTLNTSETFKVVVRFSSQVLPTVFNQTQYNVAVVHFKCWNLLYSHSPIHEK